MTDASISRAVRQAVRERASFCCEYCFSQWKYCPDPLSVEHIIPQARGGSNGESNLALSCQGCNGHKHVVKDQESHLVLNLRSTETSSAGAGVLHRSRQHNMPASLHSGGVRYANPLCNHATLAFAVDFVHRLTPTPSATSSQLSLTLRRPGSRFWKRLPTPGMWFPPASTSTIRPWRQHPHAPVRRRAGECRALVQYTVAAK